MLAKRNSARYYVPLSEMWDIRKKFGKEVLNNGDLGSLCLEPKVNIMVYVTTS